MAEPFIGQIMIVGFNFPPRNWAFCDGQLLSIAQNTALFSLLGTTYGGNGQTTFALPDLRGRVPVHAGQGPGLTPRPLGQSAGSETVTLITSQMPAHTHSLQAFNNGGDQPNPQGNILAAANQIGQNIYTNVNPDTTMSPLSLGTAGGSQPHNNMQPYLVLNFCIALYGIFPPRS